MKCLIRRKDTYRSSSRLMIEDYYSIYVYPRPSDYSAEGYAYVPSSEHDLGIVALLGIQMIP